MLKSGNIYNKREYIIRNVKIKLYRLITNVTALL